MRTHTISPLINQLARFGMMNCYLVAEDDGFTLVDTGMAGSANGILEAAERAGKPIRRIALTHGHSDHVGSLDALAGRLPDVEISIGARDARLMAGDFTTDPGEPEVKPKGQATRSVPSRLLADGERVGSLLVVASPGHSPGHIAYLDTRSGALIAGDAFQTLGGVAVAGTWVPLFPLPAMATWYAPMALEIARRLRDLNPSILAVGHGRALVEPRAAIERAIAVAERLRAGEGSYGR
jgi:glyoxylase-like metal-dependent hydrolase (beta-lactamase superfamily II)